MDPTYGSSALQQFLHPNPPHLLSRYPLPSPPLPRLTSSPLPGPSSPPVWGSRQLVLPSFTPPNPSPPETGRPAHWCNNGEGREGRWQPAKRIALFSPLHYLIYSADTLSLPQHIVMFICLNTPVNHPCQAESKTH